ncbi:MAG: hypothetical protein ACOY0R_13015 [Chloroflexota bacterium]
MKTEGNLQIILRFLRSALLIDAAIAVVVLIICFIMDLVTLEAFGTFLTWGGIALAVFTSFLGVGGLVSRTVDATAFSLSGAGDMGENLRRIAENSNSSLGCFFLLIVSSLSLIGIGSLLERIGAGM